MTSAINSVTPGCNARKVGVPTLSAGYPKTLLEFALGRGADREALLAASGIDAAVLADQDNRVPVTEYLAMLEAAIEQLKEPALALLYGEAVRMQEISIVGLMGEVIGDADAGREQMDRFGRLALDDGEGGSAVLTEFVQEGAEVWLKFSSAIYVGNPRLVESGVARCVCGARTMLGAVPGLEDVKFPKAIRFMHAEPSYRATYDRIFGVPIFFGSEMNALLLDSALLQMKMPKANQYAAQILKEKAETLLQKLENSKSVSGRVREMLVPLLETGEASIGVVSKKLGVSRQTLFRRLKAEGATFKKVLDDVRRERALQYVVEKKIPVNEAAYLLGFSDPAAFSRAYKRWTGRSPREDGRAG